MIDKKHARTGASRLEAIHLVSVTSEETFWICKWSNSVHFNIFNSLTITSLRCNCELAIAILSLPHNALHCKLNNTVDRLRKILSSFAACLLQSHSQLESDEALGATKRQSMIRHSPTCESSKTLAHEIRWFCAMVSRAYWYSIGIASTNDNWLFNSVEMEGSTDALSFTLQ